MDISSNGYHISFFKPTTPQATTNRNMVVWMVSVWFIAIFGFQILLRVLERPTPEHSYLIFQQIWSGIENQSPGINELQELGQVTLSVLGKTTINPEERQVLDNALSWSIYQLTADSLKKGVIAKVVDFEKIKTEIDNLSDQGYIDAKISLSALLSPIIKLSNTDVRSKILPLELSSENMDNIANNTIKELPGIMKKYLIHNQSFLTNIRFLGFPFHYFYTAFFLLILFVGLCWIYCVKTDTMNKNLNIVD